MELIRIYELSYYMLVWVTLVSSSNGSKVIDVGGKTLSRGTQRGMAHAKFKAHKFSFLDITGIGSDHVLKGSECGLACVNIPSCFSFNLAAFSDIMNGKVLCELLPSDIYNNSKKFVASQFHHHYSIASPCMSWPCQNNGTCAAHYEKNSYVCVCAKGYTGKYCETDIDECASNPCVNDGTCADRVNGFTCSCVPGFTGTRCQTDINECSASAGVCDVNANCQNTFGSYLCSCKAGYSGDGKTCNDINECSASSGVCNVNANCQNTLGSYLCSCKAGYSGDGKACQDIDECIPSAGVCDANANCQNTLGSYLCSCKVGYSGDGKTCIDIDECASNPCLNGGTCTDGVNGFTCSCVPEFTGTRCQTGCLSGWVRRTTSCFRVIDTPTLKWSVARKTCEDLTADLAIIRSADENNFIFDLIRNQQTVTNGGAWLGLCRKDDNKFYWIDNTPLEGQYSAWANDEPNNHDEKCVQMYGKGPNEGKWNDESCSMDAKFSDSAPVALCQKAIS